jgi:hypothetical protein
MLMLSQYVCSPLFSAPILVDLTNKQGDRETARLDLDVALAPLCSSRCSLSLSLCYSRMRKGLAEPGVPQSSLLPSFWPSRVALLAPTT